MAKNINISGNTEELAKTFVNELVHLTAEVTNDRFFTLALSGGSTPKVIFKYLSENVGSKINWQKVLLFWGDERCVLPDNSESNYRMTKEYLLDNINIPSSNVFRIRGEENASIEATRYSKEVRNNVMTENGKIRFDLVMLGFGDDGHTASIFPNQMQLFDSEELFVESNNPYTGQKRISATGAIINNARNVYFLVNGVNKAKRIAEVIEKKGMWKQYPASLVAPKEGELKWFLDAEASKYLKIK